MQALHVAALTFPLVRRNSVHGNSRPQTLQIFVSILFLFLISKFGYLSLALPLLGEFSEHIEARHGDAERQERLPQPFSVAHGLNRVAEDTRYRERPYAKKEELHIVAPV